MLKWNHYRSKSATAIRYRVTCGCVSMLWIVLGTKPKNIAFKNHLFHVVDVPCDYELTDTVAVSR
jgi:hypothetical protein